jgi:tetratricopeptide (TPR) repeat protein
VCSLIVGEICVTEESGDWRRHFDEGMAHGAVARHAAAEASFRAAILLAPGEPYPHYELGYTLSLLGRHDEAIGEFTRTEDLHPGFFLVQTEIYVCHQVLAGTIDGDAVEWLRELQRLTDLGASQSAQAASIARKVIRRAPDCALGYFFLGKALVERSPKEAQQYLERCIELRADDTTAIDAKWHLGEVLRRQGRDADARGIWESIGEDYPNNPHAALFKS